MLIRMLCFVGLLLMAGCQGDSGGGGNTGPGGGGDDGGGSGGGGSGGGGTVCLGPGESADPDPDAELPAMDPGSPPNHGPAMLAEHEALMALVAHEDATHAAVADGDWCDPDVWHNGIVPGPDARVVIPADRAIVYGLDVDAVLDTVRVDGSLRFTTDRDTRLVVDTLVVDPRGEFIIGTRSDPLPADFTAEIVIPDRGDIDVNSDPMLLGRGVIAHGRTRMHGARKTSHLKVATDPMAGDEMITLSEPPVNWSIGDRVVIAGTRYTGWRWDNDIGDVRYFGTEDEVRTITAINDRRITLDEALEYDHDTPRPSLKTSVANYTRNILFTTENGENLPPHQRGHVMFMHSGDVDVRYAAFHQLGRTDKSRLSRNVMDLESVSSDSNIQGRYSFHFHRTGIDDARNPAIAVGNAVFNAPGWGFVHHDSHAEFVENASFDTFGAGFVAETGNETGIWARNIAIRAEGNDAWNPKNGNDNENFDMGRTGDGFWFQGRMVRSVDNVAASVNHGYVYLHRGDGMLDFDADRFMLPESLGLGDPSAPDDAPIRGFDGNEAFAATVGLFVVKANPMQEHDIYTVLSDFTAWEVEGGAAVEYTSHYLFRDFLIIANEPESFRQPQFGLSFQTNSSDMVVNGAEIDGFPEGIRLQKDHTGDTPLGLDQFVIIDAEYIDVATPLVEHDPAVDLVLDADDLVPGRFQLSLNEPFEYTDPATTWGTGVEYEGSKTDSIGTNPLPAGTDTLETPNQDMIAIVEETGYYRTADGEPYAVVEEYFSDRATGEIHKRGLVTWLGPEVEAAMENEYTAWGDARYAGEIDLTSQAPVAADDSVTTDNETAIVIDVLANDNDPDGDALAVDGIVNPRDGSVHAEDDGRILYRPGIGFTGEDRFHYWATDRNGHFSRATVTVTVTSP